MKILRNEIPVDTDDLPPAPVADPWLIRCWREVRGYTQAEMAKLMGWSVVAKDVNRIEGYALHIADKRVQMLASALDVTPEEIMSLPEDKAANAERYVQWVSDGRPDLTKWLVNKGV